MDNKAVDATMDCVYKWNRIVQGKTDIDDAVRRCELCFAYMMPHLASPGGSLFECMECMSCPLYQSGNGCLKQFSTWYTIYNIIQAHPEINWEETYFNWEFAQLDMDLFHELFVLCNRMRHNLMRLLEDLKSNKKPICTTTVCETSRGQHIDAIMVDDVIDV